MFHLSGSRSPTQPCVSGNCLRRSRSSCGNYFQKKRRASELLPFGEVAHRDKALSHLGLARLFGAELRRNLQEMSVGTEQSCELRTVKRATSRTSELSAVLSLQLSSASREPEDGDVCLLLGFDEKRLYACVGSFTHHYAFQKNGVRNRPLDSSDWFNCDAARALVRQTNCPLVGKRRFRPVTKPVVQSAGTLAAWHTASCLIRHSVVVLRLPPASVAATASRSAVLARASFVPVRSLSFSLVEFCLSLPSSLLRPVGLYCCFKSSVLVSLVIYTPTLVNTAFCCLIIA